MSASFFQDSSARYVPPWTEPYIIGVAGNSGSGKTSVSQKIIQQLNQPWTVLLSFDNFYNPLTPEQREQAFASNFDFDMPSSFDMDLVYETVKKIKRGEKTEIPLYSFKLHNRTSKTTTIYGANVIIIEGIYALHDKRLLDLMDLKIYVDTDLDVCLARRLTRDILLRGRDLDGAIRQWEKFVKPNSVRYIAPQMQNAQVVLPRGLENERAIALMISHIEKQLAAKSAAHMRALRALGKHLGPVRDIEGLCILPTTNQTRGINSIIFGRDSGRDDFVFCFDRMAVLLVELALDFLDKDSYAPHTVRTSATHNYQYSGLSFCDDIIAVNIIRSGDCFLPSIKKSIPDVLIGKMLIQSDARTGEPQLHYESLPPSINAPNRKVFLFDSQVISGAAAIMAIQILLDHKVRPENIVLVTYLSTELGLGRIKRSFPTVKCVVGKLSSIEPSAEDAWYNEEKFRDSDWFFSNRFIDSLYFGT